MLHRYRPKKNFFCRYSDFWVPKQPFWPYFGLGAKVKVPYLRNGKADHPNFWYAVKGHIYEYTY